MLCTMSKLGGAAPTGNGLAGHTRRSGRGAVPHSRQKVWRIEGGLGFVRPHRRPGPCKLYKATPALPKALAALAAETTAKAGGAALGERSVTGYGGALPAPIGVTLRHVPSTPQDILFLLCSAPIPATPAANCTRARSRVAGGHIRRSRWVERCVRGCRAKGTGCGRRRRAWRSPCVTHRSRVRDGTRGPVRREPGAGGPPGRGRRGPRPAGTGPSLSRAGWGGVCGGRRRR
ncbi:hypothetical protein HDA31_002721 [Micromonospora carbonacea subsp. aurantiaca]|nr:hypothetical protein [Micromonospora carbonacea]